MAALGWIALPALKAIGAMALALCAASAAAAPQAVRFDSLDGTPLTAWMFQPAVQPATGTVVALHGCDGLYAPQGRRTGQLNPRHLAMAELLVAQGYAVVFPDSFTPRGEGEMCAQKFEKFSVDLAERRADALAAVAWVAAQPWSPTGGRIALLGWSHGGTAVLSATDASRPDVRGQRVRPALAVAFYPGCGSALASGYRPQAPLVLMLGEKDDWMPPGPCVALGKAAGAEVKIHRGSHHHFDAPSSELQVLAQVPDGVNPGRGVHVGGNAPAREQAYARLSELLEKAFK